jgi:hypothetical protein
MDTDTKTQIANEDELLRQEYSLVIDGVIAIPTDIDPDTFFDGLLDKLIEYVEEHHGVAGLGMSHKEYEDQPEDELADDDKFWRLIEERRQQKTIGRAELEQKVKYGK